MNRRLFLAVAVALVVSLLGAALVLIPGLRSGAQAGGVGIAGSYVPVVNLGPNSRDRVTLDVYVDFTCPACRTYHTDALPQLREKFGRRLEIREHFLAPPGVDSSAKVLYDVAVGKGMGSKIADALMSSGLTRESAAETREEVAKVAGEFSLTEQYERALEDRTAIQSLRDEWNSLHGLVRSFPTVVLEREIEIGSNASNAVVVIGSVLSGNED